MIFETFASLLNLAWMLKKKEDEEEKITETCTPANR